jgi:hypothetical protein
MIKTIPILEVDGDCERNDKSTSASHWLCSELRKIASKP